MEDNLNGRRPLWKKASMEDNLNTRGPQWKKTMKDNLNGRQPQGRQPQFTLMSNMTRIKCIIIPLHQRF